MGIHIKLKPLKPRIGSIAYAIGRLTYMELILNYLQESEQFIARELEAWRNADNEPMGGSRVFKSPEVNQKIKDLYKAWFTRFYKDEWYDSVIVVKGSFNIRGKYYAGYISANNDENWRNMYMDITIDSFGAGDKGDLTLLLLEDGLESHVKNFVERVASEQIDPYVYINEIYWSAGPTGFGDVDGIYAVHLASWSRMVDYMIQNMSQEEDPIYEEQIKPLRRRFFGSSLKSVKEVKNFTDTFMTEEQILTILNGSVTYISEDPTAFRRFYQKFRDHVLVKAAQRLPHREELEAKITSGIREGLGLMQKKLE